MERSLKSGGERGSYGRGGGREGEGRTSGVVEGGERVLHQG